jgi:putative (di)nucleoside polyphosphate hydrolase
MERPPPSKPRPDPILYRPNVAAILRRADGRVLVAERINVLNSWQFPQGGVDDGETMEQALFREVQEEVGVAPELVKILSSKGGYRYAFTRGRLKYGIYGGQVQTYFLCEFSGSDKDIRLDAHQREFSRYQWIMPEEFRISWVPKFKRGVYFGVFRDFFSIDLEKQLSA